MDINEIDLDHGTLNKLRTGLTKTLEKPLNIINAQLKAYNIIFKREV
jgi:hypothetical protein